MSYSVVKLGGSVFWGPRSAPVVALIASRRRGDVAFVVSALRGVTDGITAFARDGGDAVTFARALAGRYRLFARAFRAPPGQMDEVSARIDALEAEFLSVSAGSGPDRFERLVSYGERFAAVAFCAALAADDAARGSALRRAFPAIFPEDLGLLAEEGPDGRGDATVPDPAACSAGLARALALHGRISVPGFYGLDRSGGVCLFGRGGSDYTATVLAAASGGGDCSLYKDAEGVRSADPALVRGTVHVPELSYREAAALAEGGAKILHAGAAREASARGVPVLILPSDGRAATRIGATSPRDGSAGRPKSISATRSGGLAALSLVGEGVGRASACTAKALDALFAARVRPLDIRYERSGVSLTVTVAERDRVRALRAVHEEFFGKGIRA